MKAAVAIGLGVAGLGLAFLVGFGTAPIRQASAGPESLAPPLEAGSDAVVSPGPRTGRGPLPTARRFEPPPIPADDPGIAELVNAPDEPPAEVMARRWENLDRRMDELFGETLPAERRVGIRMALTSWMRDHGRAVRAFYRGSIDESELADNVHANMLAYAHAVESTLNRDQYRKLMDLDPGEDPYIVLVPPDKSVGDTMDKPEHDEAPK